MEEIRIIICDDHEIIRIGLRSLLRSVKHFHIVAEASDGKMAVELVREHRPDVLLVDILMPVMTGIEAVRSLRQENTDVKIIMLTSIEDNFHLTQAMNAGANGYLSKEVGKQELIEAIQAVLEGEKVFSAAIIEIMANPDIPVKEAVGAVANSNIYLSKREQEILSYIAEGLTSKEIGDTLFISPRTVETHRNNLMQKLQIKNTAGLVRFALLNLK